MIPTSLRGYLYLLAHPDGFVKVGFTTCPQTRFYQYSHGTDVRWPSRPAPLTVIGLLDNCYYADERALHQMFAGYRVSGREWYSDEPAIRAYFQSRENVAWPIESPQPGAEPQTQRCFRCPDDLWFYLVRSAALRDEPIKASELIREILENYAAKHPLPKGVKLR